MPTESTTHQTYGDCIRAMSDEELTGFILDVFNAGMIFNSLELFDEYVYDEPESVLERLREPAKTTVPTRIPLDLWDPQGLIVDDPDGVIQPNQKGG